MTFSVQGWGTSQVLSSETSTRVVDFVGFKDSAQAVTAAVTDITFASNKDSHGAWDGSDEYVVPVPGDYDVSTTLGENTTLSVSFGIYVNGAAYRGTFFASVSGNLGSGSIIVPNLKAGDRISIRCNSSVTIRLNGLLSIKRISGPAQIAASEKVFCQYTNNSGTGTTANVTDIPFITRVQDSHGAFASGVFTAPRASWYDVDASVTYAANAVREHTLYVNGTQRLRMDPVSASISVYSLSAGVYLNAGETLSIRNNNSSTLQASAVTHWISVRSQG
jgi:hypothetical protein